MSDIFKDTIQGLLEAIDIKNGCIPLSSRDNMDYPTLYVVDDDVCGSSDTSIKQNSDCYILSRAKLLIFTVSPLNFYTIFPSLVAT